MTAPARLTLAGRAAESAAYLRARGVPRAEIGLVLGTGLGGLGAQIDPAPGLAEGVPYGEIPHFAPAAVEGHGGRLLAGRLGGRDVVALQGRIHMYEGHALQEVAYPVRVLRALGAGVLVLSNAAGGLNPLFELGDLMLLDDHVNLMGDNPLRGPNEDALGPRFPDMSEPYDRRLLALAEEVALRERIRVRRGVYVAVCGPALETPAEYRFLRGIGADAVGMSTVPEVIAARHAGMRVLALSVITDRCLPDALEPVDVAQILRVAAGAEPRLARLVVGVLRELDAGGPPAGG